MPTYRTAGAWGAGKGSNLTPAEVDGNFYELRTDLDDFVANPPVADSVVSVSQSGFNLTFHTTLGNDLGPLAMPVVQFRWRGEWSPLTLYEAADTFIVEGEGLFTVTADHTSAAAFDPDAVGGSPAEPLYNQLFGVGTNSALDDLIDVDAAAPSLGQVLTWTGSPASWQPANVSTVAALDDLTDVSVPSPADGDVLTYQAGSPTGWVAAAPAAVPSTLDSLTDVSVPSPADGDFLRYNAGSPAGWTNEAGTAISDLDDATLPIDIASLIEVSEPTGSPLTFASKKITVEDLLAAGDFTLGSTAIALGSTVTTVAGLELSDPELSGTTVLEGGGEITSAGEVGLGGAATARLSIVGSYTTSNANLIQIGGTFAPSGTGTLSGLNIGMTVAPSGGAVTNFRGLISQPIVDASAPSFTTFLSNTAGGIVNSGYAGTITNWDVYRAATITLNGATVTNLAQYKATSLNSGGTIASGSFTRRQFWAEGLTVGSSGATVDNRGFEITVPAGNASGGTVNNRGIYITGNGGTPSGGGTVDNFAFLSDSTAYSRIEGGFGVGVTTRNATTATSPYFYIPTCAGTPTGVPRNAAVGATAMIFDDTAHKLWLYEQSTGTWKGVVVA